ncbi:TonB-linked outer membrane protein, SusC/RagA family [bacterium A37T11]|nr:TonB-linked outer membrane protein, SusC/RagA family [bacterium A37T11]
MKLTRLLYLLASLSFSVGYGQQQRLTGQVTSALDQSPLAGASLRLKLSGNATHSGPDGQFRLPVPSGPDTLLVHYLGFQDLEVALSVKALSFLRISLTPATSELQEAVVNTGYYQVPIERSTGSFTQVDQALLNRSTGSNLLQRLEGVTSGLQFSRNRLQGEDVSGTPDLRVRGLSTIESDNRPLIIVDNFPYESDISTLNPNDVLSVTILKDAAAASIWGARAGNGVIVISTKQGQYQQRNLLSFNSSITSVQKPDLFYSKSFLPSATEMAIEKELFDAGLDQEQANVPLQAYTELLIRQRDGLISEADFDHESRLLGQSDIRKEALTYLYQTTLDQQYALNASGGGNAYRYYTGLGYDRQRGSSIGNNNSRLTINTQNTFQLSKQIEVSTGIWYESGQKTNNGLTMEDLSSPLIGNPSTYSRLADGQGHALPLVRDWRQAYVDGAATLGLLDWNYRPLDELQLADNSSHSSEIRINSHITYHFFDHFDLQGSYQYLHSNQDDRNYYAPDTYFVRNLVNQFTQPNGNLIIPNGGILRGSGPQLNSSHSGRVQLNYAETFQGLHQIAALAGVDMRQQVSASQPGYLLYNYDDDVRTSDILFDYSMFYELQPEGYNYGYLPTPPTSTAYFTNRELSYYGNASYTYKGRYIVSASSRWDGSNLFGVKANQRGVPLWSAGLSWELDKEPFYRLAGLPYARLRATYGRSGNVNKTISHYAVIRYGSNTVTGLHNALLTSPGNPSLRWEKVNTLNTALDLATSDKRIQASLEYYLKISTDLIGDKYMDPTVGITNNYKINYADMRTQGFDLQVTAVPVPGLIRWESVLLLSYVRNKITRFEAQELTSIDDYFHYTPPVKGLSRDMMLALPWNGLSHENGMPVIYQDGLVSTDYRAYYENFDPGSLVQAGLSVPPFFGSFRNTLRWKQLELSVLVSFKTGYVFRRRSIGPGAEYYNGNNGFHTDYLKRWKQPGDEAFTSVPAAVEPGVYRPSNNYVEAVYRDSEALISKGDHIRLQDIQCSYTLPVRKGFLAGKNLRLYAYARDLGILWRANKEGIDPDYAQTNYPPPASYSFGLQATF